MNNITPILSHSFEKITKEPTCTDKGYTTSTCTMCGLHYVSDYTEPTGHSWDEGHTVTSSTCTSEGVTEFHCLNCDEKMIKSESATGHTPGKAATCTEPQVCEKCGTVLALPKGHTYSETVIAPTCEAMGYSVFECTECGDSYTGNFTDKAEHSYNAVVTAPTCTEHGFTTYTCSVCGDSYIGDYTEKLPHDYNTVATPPTCTEMGYTTYTCKVCGDSYIGDYTDMTEHNYSQQVIPPTCTEHGYTVYTCPDCGKEYIGDLTECEQHKYSENVIPPTCLEMGYTIFTCETCGDSFSGNYVDALGHEYSETVTQPTCTELGFTTFTCNRCGDSYKGNYTDKTAHSYTKTVTEPTCLEHGFTTFVCVDCGDTYQSEYTEALGHKPSEWIIDIPATIEQAGEKHIECTVCGNVLQTAEIPRLVDTDHSDEDGDAEVGDYSIILTAENGKPVFDSEITIDKDDNVTIKLPEGRLLDYADRTTITVFYTETQAPKEGLQIFIYDKNSNAATGATDANGQLIVPNNQSSTGDDNGTIGTDDGNSKFTYVVKVTDKTNITIPNCETYIGESNNVVVKLPDGLILTQASPAIIYITDQNGVPQKDVTVIVIADKDYIEKGVTDMYGKLTVPPVNSGYTDKDGKVSIQSYYVFVADESKNIENALVTLHEDNSFTVVLPAESLIDYANRITVTVFDKDGNPVKDMNVSVKDVSEKSASGTTDENGKMTVPPLSEDYTDSEGNGVVNGYNVLVTDETKPIENAFITITDGKLNVKLPEGCLIDIENRITVTVTDSENAPVKDMPVTITDNTEKSESNLTDENGKATVPPTNIDLTDINGYAEVDGYIVMVVNETGAIEKAFVTHHAEVKNEDGTIQTAENISVELPENIKVDDYSNRVTVTALNKTDNTSVAKMLVTVTEATVQAEQPEQPKSASGITDKDGKVTVPPLDEDMTDDNGDGYITEIKPGEDTDGDGEPDAEETETTYTVTVSSKDGNIANALIKIEGGKVTVTLPDTHTLTTSNQTTVTVKDKDGNPVKGVSVIIKDKTTEKSGTTNSGGQVTLPVKSTGGGGGSISGGGGGGGFVSSINSVNVKVTDKDGKTVNVSKSTGSDKVTLTLPAGKTLEGGNWYTVTVTDRNGKAKADYTVILKDRENNEATGKTGNDGVIVLPAVEHNSYIVGYEDGAFRPDSDMTRAEAAAIFARLISEQKAENISGTKNNFTDVKSGEWYAGYVSYLEKYGIIKGYEDNTFRPDEAVTRAEFVSMTVRFYGLFDKVSYPANTTKYSDIDGSHWAVKDISFGKEIGWLNGYADGTFKPDNNITRAEVVTVVNHATDRTPDEEYINKNLSVLNKFTDLKNNSHWGYYDIMEAANTHNAVTNSDTETWVK